MLMDICGWIVGCQYLERVIPLIEETIFKLCNFSTDINLTLMILTSCCVKICRTIYPILLQWKFLFSYCFDRLLTSKLVVCCIHGLHPYSLQTTFDEFVKYCQQPSLSWYRSWLLCFPGYWQQHPPILTLWFIGQLIMKEVVAGKDFSVTQLKSWLITDIVINCWKIEFYFVSTEE